MTYDRKPMPMLDRTAVAATVQSAYQPRHQFMTMREVAAQPRPRWLVKGLLPSNSIGVIYGKPGAGKTFFTLALAQSIAHGMACFGRKTVRGNVAIIAGEGAGGLQSRVVGWHQFHGLDIDLCDGVQVLPHAVDMLDADVVEQLAHDIAFCFRGQPVDVVVFDTLARCFGDGDENRQPDMSRMVQAGDAIRNALGCAVLFIHHTPKEGDELRGSSVLEAACDVVLRIGKTETGMEAFVRKMKDGRDNIAFDFRMEYQPVGTDDDGELISTRVAVLEGGERAGALPAKASGPRGKNQSALLDLLSSHEDGLTDAEWLEKAKAASMVTGEKAKRDFDKAKEALLRDKWVMTEGERFLAV